MPKKESLKNKADSNCFSFRGSFCFKMGRMYFSGTPEKKKKKKHPSLLKTHCLTSFGTFHKRNGNTETPPKNKIQPLWVVCISIFFQTKKEEANKKKDNEKNTAAGPLFLRNWHSQPHPHHHHPPTLTSAA